MTQAHQSTNHNRLLKEDECVHSWYRFVLGYPPHLVRHYLDTFQVDSGDVILDPFCGTGTTPVEARLQGFAVAGVEANPMAVLASQAKLDWLAQPEMLDSCSRTVVEKATGKLRDIGIAPVPVGDQNLFSPAHDPGSADLTEIPELGVPPLALEPEQFKLIPAGFISPRPLVRILAVRTSIDEVCEDRYRHFLLVALARVIVRDAGNLGFGPEVYRKPPKPDADVLGCFEQYVSQMASDLRTVQGRFGLTPPEATVIDGDARALCGQGARYGIVITSPPYPNEKDYTRTTRLESVLLGLIRDKKALRASKDRLLRSNTRTVFKSDDDERHVAHIASINRVADEIEARRVALGKTSGFERLYHRVTRLYFGGMWLHLQSLFPLLTPGARCAYVVGDQMSYFRVPIRTAHLLADVATDLGYEVLGIELWRTRKSTVTGVDLEENTLLLRRP